MSCAAGKKNWGVPDDLFQPLETCVFIDAGAIGDERTNVRVVGRGVDARCRAKRGTQRSNAGRLKSLALDPVDRAFNIVPLTNAPRGVNAAAQAVRAQVNHQNIEAAALKSVERGAKIEEVAVKLGSAIFAPPMDHHDGLAAPGPGNPPSGDFDAGIP